MGRCIRGRRGSTEKGSMGSIGGVVRKGGMREGGRSMRRSMRRGRGIVRGRSMRSITRRRVMAMGSTSIGDEEAGMRIVIAVKECTWKGRD